MTKLKPAVFKLAVISLISFMYMSSASAKSAEADNSIPCLTLSRVKNVDILDNKHLVFQTGVNDFYLNTLPYACNGLRLNDSFLYSTSINQICNVDVISVLNKTGPGYQTGASCGLGFFVAIDKDEIKMLRDELKAK
jgi:hypothetical protein